MLITLPVLCSECGHALEEAANECPNCGGLFSQGDIRTMNRQAAKDFLLQCETRDLSSIDPADLSD